MDGSEEADRDGDVGVILGGELDGAVDIGRLGQPLMAGGGVGDGAVEGGHGEKRKWESGKQRQTARSLEWWSFGVMAGCGRSRKGLGASGWVENSVTGGSVQTNISWSLLDAGERRVDGGELDLNAGAREVNATAARPGLRWRGGRSRLAEGGFADVKSKSGSASSLPRRHG